MLCVLFDLNQIKNELLGLTLVGEKREEGILSKGTVRLCCRQSIPGQKEFRSKDSPLVEGGALGRDG